MRTNIQVRRYTALAQVDQDLRLIEPSIAGIEKVCAAIEESTEFSGKLKRYIHAVEDSANLHRVMSNVRMWMDHTPVKEGPKNVEDKLSKLNKRLAVANSRLRKCGASSFKASNKLRSTAGQIKLFSDSLLVNNFENASTASLLLVDRETHKAIPVIQTAYSNVIDTANFQYPEIFISVSEVDGAFEVGLSRTGSLFKSGRFSKFTDVEIAKMFVGNILGGMKVVRKKGR